MLRRTLVAVTVVLVVASSGCTSIKRAAIRNQLKRSFVVLPGTELTKVAPDVYAYRWVTVTTMFITTPEGVILFDPINEEAVRGLTQEIARVAPNPEIKYVIYSHFHRDHAGGAAHLPGHPVILAHANAARELAQRDLPEVQPPTETFTDEVHTVTLGGETVQLMHLPYSHTDGLLMAYLPRHQILFQVDVMWNQQLPPPSVPDFSFSGIKRATEMMLQLDTRLVVNAHGPIGSRKDLERYHQFLGDLEQAMTAALERRGLQDMGTSEVQINGLAQMGDVFFEVEDTLRPKYSDWSTFDALILPTSTWCFWHLFTGT